MQLKNNNIKITNQQEKELRKIIEIQVRHDALTNNFKHLDQLTDELYVEQPFLISLIMSYRQEHPIQEFQELVRIYIIIWEYFRSNSKTKKPIAQIQFERIEKLNLQLFQDKDQAMKTELNGILAGVILDLNTKAFWENMDAEKRENITFDLKTVIDCFFELAGN